MKNQIIKTTIVFLIIILSNLAANAQAINTPYFLENTPTRHLYNPAFQPQGTWYLSIPLMGHVQAGIFNNSVSVKDLVYKDVRGNTVTAFSPHGRDKLYNKMRDGILIAPNLDINLLGFGFRTSIGYWTVGINTKMDLDIVLPKTGLLLYGTGTVHEPKVSDFSKLGVKSNFYSELALGYSTAINDKLTVGGKIKLLYGHGGMNTINNRLDLTTGVDKWAIDGDMSLLVAMPMSIYNEAENKFEMGTASFREWFSPSGMGAGIDLGATYKLNNELSFAASVTDLGFIRWTKNATDLYYNTSYSFTGVEIDGFNFDHIGGFVDSTFNALQQGFNPKSIESFTTGTTAKINLSAEYAFFDSFSVGLLSRTMFYKRTRQDFTLAANYRPFDALNLTAAFTLINGRTGTLGFAAATQLGAFNFFLGADYLPLRYVNIPFDVFSEGSNGSLTLPYATKGMNFAFGFNLVFGRKKAQDLVAMF